MSVKAGRGGAESARIAELDARQAAYRKDCADWYVDYDHEPEIASNAFFRGWDAAVARFGEVPCGALPDEYIDHSERYRCELPAKHEGLHSSGHLAGGVEWADRSGA